MSKNEPNNWAMVVVPTAEICEHQLKMVNSLEESGKAKPELANVTAKVTPSSELIISIGMMGHHFPAEFIATVLTLRGDLTNSQMNDLFFYYRDHGAFLVPAEDAPKVQQHLDEMVVDMMTSHN